VTSTSIDVNNVIKNIACANNKIKPRCSNSTKLNSYAFGVC